MQFHEVRFPASLSFGASGGPERRTEIVTLANGHEERNSPWAHARRRYDAGMALRSLDDLEAVIAFFEARRGEMHGFRWKDWSDYRSAPSERDLTPADQLIGIGDEAQDTFQITKTYASGGHAYVRPIQKIVPGTALVSVGGVALKRGVDYALDETTGILTFDHPPDVDAEIRAGFEFDVPVRFATAMLSVTVATFRAGEVPQVPVIEVRV